MPPRWFAKLTRKDVLGAAASGIVTLGVLFGANAIVEWLERRGKVTTYRGVDDMINLVDAPLFEPNAEGSYVSTRYAEGTMVESRFRADKGDAWRLFVLGESFAMGSPYTQIGSPMNRTAGIPSFLQADLETLEPRREIEVINAAAGAQNSNRIRRIAAGVLELAPDALVVAMCNNEGSLEPSRVTEEARKFGGIRYLLSRMAPTPRPEDRPYYTAQDPDTSAVRDAFRRNLRAILEGAKQKGVKVLLCTMPVNLRYVGRTMGHGLLDHYQAPPLPTAPCVAQAASLAAEHPAEADRVLASCDDVEVLRMQGMLRYEAGDFESARVALESYTELVPRNRCRPSFNQIIREAADAFPGNVRLVDLQAKANELSPHGLAGDEIFVDSCHMNWMGYKAMEDEVFAVMEREGWLPGKGGVRISRAALRERFGLKERRGDEMIGDRDDVVFGDDAGTASPASLVARSGPPTAPLAEAAQLALIAPIAVGSHVADFVVENIATLPNGYLQIDCVSAAGRILVQVALVGPGSPTPPMRIGKYGIYYHALGSVGSREQGLLGAVAGALRANDELPAPAALREFAR